ncbi:hypothetical protein N7G274_002039 [Stereocaulon virgatum]|uniref:Mannose-1-phosphate guanyltransferase n=1 Tax=Stereocaulon virgatum TaxID=373712 RepID=A0ABR4AJD3_9LECA
MPPKNPKAAKAKQKPQEEQREESLQAVVLADSFETRFVPFTLERPRCLLPLANTPLIEYTLEFLAHAGVQEVYVYCGSHAEQLEDYINASKWTSKSSPFRTLKVLKSTATSVGEAMRSLDQLDVITGDFLLVSGDVVSNMNLEPALLKHRARREKSKDAIMTMVLREAGVGHRTKSKGSRPVFVIDPAAERCLHYEEMGGRRGGSRYVTLDPELLTSHGEIEVRDDLIDCHIDICALDVLAQWSDNFDFQSLRKSFLRGVLKDYETYGKTVHTYIVTDQYAARVKSLRAYDAVSKDILGRWAYPLCPDSNLVPGQSYYFGRGKVYQENNVSLGRAAVVKRSVIGSGTSVGDGGMINRSTVGRRCRIGKNVTIEGAYIWDDVTVEDGSIIRQAIIANGTSIGKHCPIEPGALISFRAQIPENTKVSAESKIIRDRETGYSNDRKADDSDASSVASSRLIYRNPSASSSVSSISTLTSSDADLKSDRDASRRSSYRSDPSDDARENQDFHLEATGSILDGLQKSDPADTIMLELNGYRMSTNASQHEVRKAVVAAFMKRISNLIARDNTAGAAPLTLREAVKAVLTEYKSLVERTTFDSEAEEKVDQVDFLLLVQKEAMGRPNGDQLLLFMANEAYDLDVIEEDGVLQWWEDERSQEGEMGTVRVLSEQFITFLKEAEEDESEDEDDEEDDD